MQPDVFPNHLIPFSAPSIFFRTIWHPNAIQTMTHLQLFFLVHFKLLQVFTFFPSENEQIKQYKSVDIKSHRQIEQI